MPIAVASFLAATALLLATTLTRARRLDLTDSDVRIHAELRRLRRKGQRPMHWPIRVYAPLLLTDQHADYAALEDLGHPPVTKRLMHPQELMTVSGRWPAYYAARLDRAFVRFVRPTTAPPPGDSR